MNSSLRQILCVFVLTVCSAAPLLADSVTFTDLGPGGTFGKGGFAVLGVNNTDFPGTYQGVANPFTASVGGTLSQIDLGLTYRSGTNSAEVSVYTDVSNNLGTLLFSGSVSNQPAFGSTTLTTLSASSGILVAGDSYFLVLTPGAADTHDTWAGNTVGAQGAVLIDSGSGFSSIGTQTLSAFDVKVTAATVPEPSTWLMLGAEVLCLFSVVSWKRCAVKAI